MGKPKIYAVGLVIAMLWTGASSLRAAEPPSVEQTVPINGATRVPTNASIWLFGPSLSMAKPELTLERLDAQGGVAAKLSVDYRASIAAFRGTFGKGAKAPAWLGQRARRLMVVRPRVALEPNARHRLTHKVFPTASKLTLTFTTGPGPDRKAPSSAALQNQRFHTISRRGGSSRVTLVDLGPVVDDGAEPLLIQFLGGPRKEPHHVALIPKAKAVTLVVSPPSKGPLRARLMDLAGNQSPPFSAPSAPPLPTAKSSVASARDRKKRGKGCGCSGAPGEAAAGVLLVFALLGLLVAVRRMKGVMRRSGLSDR